LAIAIMMVADKFLFAHLPTKWDNLFKSTIKLQSKIK
jgi:hypothetical protein